MLNAKRFRIHVQLQHGGTDERVAIGNRAAAEDSWTQFKHLLKIVAS